MHHQHYRVFFFCALCIFAANLCSPAVAQLRLLQPNGGELLPVTGEYIVKWTGVNAADMMYLEYSLDGGTTWKFFAKAAGLSYRWKPVPAPESDSCLVRVSFPKDVTSQTAPVNMSASAFTGGQRYYSSSEYSPDGKLIITHTRVGNTNQAAVSYRVYTRVQDAISGAILYDLPPVKYADVNLSNFYGYGYPGTNYSNGNSKAWSPDGRRFVNQLNDTTLGIFETSTGTLLGQMQVLHIGKPQQFEFANMHWYPDGTTISAIYTEIYLNVSGNTIWYDSSNIRRLTWDISTTMVRSNVRETVSFSVSTGHHFSLCGNVAGSGYYGSVSNDGQRYITYCPGQTPTIRNTETGLVVQTISSNMIGISTEFWSPNDSLIAFVSNALIDGKNKIVINMINSWTGSIIQQIDLRDYAADLWLSWSPDGAKLIVSSDYRTVEGKTEIDKAIGKIIDVKTGKITVLLQQFGSNPYYVSGVNGPAFVSGEIYNLGYDSNKYFWNPDGTKVASYLADDPTKIGIWDANTGCLLEVISTNHNNDIFLSNRRSSIQWSPDGKHILNNYADVAVVYTIPPGACSSDVSDALFFIRSTSNLVTPSAISFPKLLCETSTTQTIALQNVGTKTISIGSVELQGIHASDFIIVQQPSLIAAGGTDSVTVRFVPTTTGTRTAQLVITSTADNATTQTITLTGQKDVVGFQASALRLNFGEVPPNTATTASFTMTNTGTIPLVWDLTIGATADFVIESVEPYPTPVGGQSLFTVRFKGGKNLTTYQGAIPFFNCGSRTANILLEVVVALRPAVIAVNKPLDFGTLICTDRKDTTLTVRNTGGQALTIGSMTIEGGATGGGNTTGFTMLQGAPSSIKGGDSALVPVRFTALRDGSTSAQLVIVSDDPINPRFAITLNADKKTALFELSTTAIVVNDVTIGTTVTRTTTLQNKGTLPLWWDLNLWKPDTAKGIVLENIVPNPTPAGGSSLVTVRVLAGKGGETRSNFFAFRDTCGNARTLTVNASIQKPLPIIEVDNPVAFGELLCETAFTVPVSIRNVGGRELVITDVSFSGSNKEDFSLLTDVTQMLRLPAFDGSVASQTFLRVKFQPLDTGLREARMKIRSNASNASADSTFEVVLRGRKERVSFTASKTQANFTTVQENTALRDTLVVTNTGTRDIRWTQAPIAVDENFTIERITPQILPRGGQSQVIVRFAGGKAGLSATKLYLLSAQECNQALPLTLNAVVQKQPRLAAVRDTALRLLCLSAQNLTLRLQNTGTDDVLVRSVKVLDDGNTEVRIPCQPVRITPNAVDSVCLELRPKTTGTKTFTLRIESNAADRPTIDVRLTVQKDSSGIRLDRERLEFPALGANSSIEATFTLINTGTIEQRWLLPAAFGENGVFAVQDVTPNPTPAGGRSTVRMRFDARLVGNRGGVYAATATFKDSCGREAPLQLAARVVTGEAVLQEQIQLAPSLETEVPVYLRKRGGIEAGTTATFMLRVGNTTLVEVLAPMPVSSTIDKGARVLRFAVPITTTDENEPLLRLKLRGLLGNDSVTTLRVDSLRVGGVLLTGAQSRYQTIGLNYAGGVRLFYVPAVTLKSIAPNPTSAEASIVLNVNRATNVSVTLVDVYGRRMQVMAGVMGEGEQAVVLNTSGLASGVYMVEVQSVDGIQTARINVIR